MKHASSGSCVGRYSGFLLALGRVRGLPRNGETGRVARAGWIITVGELRLGMRIKSVGGFLAALVLLQGCERNPYQLTECVGGKPLVERIDDVAPPNC